MSRLARMILQGIGGLKWMLGILLHVHLRVVSRCMKAVMSVLTHKPSLHQLRKLELAGCRAICYERTNLPLGTVEGFKLEPNSHMVYSSVFIIYVFGTIM